MSQQSFRSIELSDASFEEAGLRFLTVKTPNLRGRGDVCLFVPKQAAKLVSLPIYILLHGVYGSSWVWALKGGVHLSAQKLIDQQKIKPAIIAMPSDGLWGDGSGYLNHSEKQFEQWIISDVPKAIRENIPQADDHSLLCIGGLSMGGYGALRLGANFPNIFQAISAHSTITRLSEMKSFVEEPITSYRGAPSFLDVIQASEKHREILPPIRFDCGTSDPLLAANRTLHKQFTQMSIPHTYEEFPGGHEWAYWQEHVVKSLRFFDQHCEQK
ncbi:MAG: alpha/beta hydrolase-fold protein [Bacteroidota bacterium]